MNLIGAMLIMLSCTAAGIMKARSLSELDKTYGTLIAMLTLIKNEIITLSAPLEELGASLGRYDSTMQCTAIDRCINEISLEQQTLRLSLSSNKRMYIGIGGATGLIIAIVLI